MATAFDSMYLPGGDFDVSDLKYTIPQVNMGTISPRDLHVDDTMVMSNPPSTAFPNYYTPESSLLESPAMVSSAFDTSPMQDGGLDSQLNFAELDSMPSLFPQDNLDQFAEQSLDLLNDFDPGFVAVNSHSAPSGMQRQKSSGMERQKSSPGRPPTQPYHVRNRSGTCGINKAPKPRKDLKPLDPDDQDDKDTAKRKKNTLAARKSRARKLENAEASAAEIDRLRSIILALGGDPDLPEED